MIPEFKFPLSRWTNHCPDDYLVKFGPGNRDKVQRYIDEGKFQDWSLLHFGGGMITDPLGEAAHEKRQTTTNGIESRYAYPG